MSSSCTHCTSGTKSKGFCPFSLFLFAASAIPYVRYLQNKSKKRIMTTTSSESEEPFRVVFVLGGPGAGKGTQCQLLSQNLGWVHLSRSEGIVPSEINVTSIKNVMAEVREATGQTKFLIDGFPRSEGNVNSWKEVVGDKADVECVLFFECPEDILTSRLLERAKTSGRVDDSIDVIRKRFVTYHEESMPIIKMYEAEGKVRKIIADRAIEEVYKEVEALLK